MNQILVVGSLHYDIVIGTPHLPRTDETVPGSDARFVCGGKGGNQAVAAARHGASVGFVGAVGKDYFAEPLLDNLEKACVDISRIARCEDLASGMSVALIEPSGEYGAVVASGANLAIDAESVFVPAGTKYLILQNEIPAIVNLAAARQARSAACQVVLNAAPMRRLEENLLKHVDILIVNRIEAEALLGHPVATIADAKAGLRKLHLPCAVIVVTLGEQGLVYNSSQIPPTHLAAPPVDCISTHGAGDTFVGALCARLVGGDDLYAALSYASRAAALHVSTPFGLRHTIAPEGVEAFARTLDA